MCDLDKIVLDICDRRCGYKNNNNSCKVRLKKGMDRARKSNFCKLYKNLDEAFANNKAKCEKTCKQ